MYIIFYNLSMYRVVIGKKGNYHLEPILKNYFWRIKVEFVFILRTELNNY